MFTPYFSENDCYALNCKQNLSHPWAYRLANFLRGSFPANQNNREKLPLCNKKFANKILSKIETLRQEIHWEQNLLTASYAVFDCETTGLQPFKGDQIISLGGVIIEKGKLQNEKVFNQLVNPLRPIPPLTAVLTGITNAMTADKPTIYQVLPDFLEFLGNRILIAHRATFDLSFLNLALGRIAPVRIPQPVIDTYLLSRHLLPALEEHTLDSLGTSLAVKITQRHTALGDARITAQLFLKLLQRLAEKKILTLGQLRNYLQLKKTTEASLTISATSF